MLTSAGPDGARIADDDDDDDDDDVADERSENCAADAARLDCATGGGTNPCDTSLPVPWLTYAAAELDELALGGGTCVGGASSGG